MKKLNKNGWGLRSELMFIILFMVCLLIATIGLIRFGLLGDNNNVKGNINSPYFSYPALELQLNNASVRYYNSHYYNEYDDNIIIRSYALVNFGYMKELLDEDGKPCVGYTRVVNQNNGPSFTSYISCPKYKTNGYDYE